MSLTKAQRAGVFAMFNGHCAYCGCVLDAKKWHADHIEAVLRDSKWVPGNHSKPGKFVQTGVLLRPENERMNNYFPACIPCNIDKSCEPLEGWRKGMENRVEICRRNHSAFRHAERFGLIAQVKTNVVFYFETLSEPTQGEAK